ncbi:Atrial natriuretic peptide receptor 1 [Hypsibius exemplaris]|uniref:Guanylate cyclase n=1 Tax=Hypsibius exemplaris TaxID=2072580 RepID=A0A1W0WP40_HYPEX|nr:Atrial natriuretic peptide receptor 1 [Hypsibius exemplaris]
MTNFRTLLTVTLLLCLSRGHKALTGNLTTLNVCSVIEKGQNALVYNYLRAAAAIDMAVEYANDAILPDDVRLKFFYKDGGSVCSANNKAVESALDWTKEGVQCNVYIGPGCDRAVADLYQIAAYRQVPIIGCPSANIEGNTGLRRNQMPLLIRPAYSFTDICRLVIIFLNTFNYTHTTILTDETNQFFSELGGVLTSRYRVEREDLYLNAKLLLFRSNEADEARYQALLTDAGRRSRVIVIFGNATVVRSIMVYIAIELFKSKAWGEFTWKNHDTYERDAQSAYRSLALLALYETRDQFFSEFQKEVRSRARKDYNYIFGAFEEIDPVVTSFYDAIVLYASTANKLFHSGHNLTDGLAMAEEMKNTTIDSPLGYSIDIDVDGDRTRAYSLKQMSSESGKFEDILRIDYHNFEEIWYGKFMWPGRDGLPPNAPGGFNVFVQLVAGIGGQPAAIAGIVLALMLTAVGIAGGAMSMKRANKKAVAAGLDPYWWRIQLEELQFIEGKVLLSDIIAKSISQLHNSTGNGSVVNKSIPLAGNGSQSRSNWNNARGLTAFYQAVAVCVLDVPKRTYKTSASLIKELNQVRAIIHPNLLRFIGLCLTEDSFCDRIVCELCTKGSLETILEDDKIKLDWAFKYSMLKDLTEGMTYLHSSPIASHGFLTGFNCLIDSRFVLKIANYGISAFVNPADLLAPDKKDTVREDYSLLLYRAPELLRVNMPGRGTQKGDIYSYGVILQQIILRSPPYSASTSDEVVATYNYQESPREIVFEVQAGSIPPMRPIVPRSACCPALFALMESCWAEFAMSRPPFPKIKEAVRKIVGRGSANIVDYLIARMEQYATNLEGQVAEKTLQFMAEKTRSEELLSQLLPKVIAAALTKGESVSPESYDCVSIYFSDIVGFTTICSAIAPMEVVTLLNNLYTLFDGVLESYDVYKVETIGDAYMVSSGLPVRNGKRHASEIANVSLHIRRDISSFEIPRMLKDKLQVRIGIHSGSCVAGIVGHKMPRYCLFGDTVNVASRMESTGEPMKIQTSERTKELLDNIGGFHLEERGEIYVKGKGTMKTYWLVSLLSDASMASKKEAIDTIPPFRGMDSSAADEGHNNNGR